MGDPWTPDANRKYGKEALYPRGTWKQKVPRKQNASPRRKAKTKQITNENIKEEKLEYPTDPKQYGAHEKSLDTHQMLKSIIYTNTQNKKLYTPNNTIKQPLTPNNKA